jgi:hypothetical protein
MDALASGKPLLSTPFLKTKNLEVEREKRAPKPKIRFFNHGVFDFEYEREDLKEEINVHIGSVSVRRQDQPHPNNSEENEYYRRCRCF